MKTSSNRSRLRALLLLLTLGIAAVPALHAAIPTDGLTAYWAFDGRLENASIASGNVSPANPSNLDLTSFGGFAFDPDGLFGQAARFDGAGAHLKIATDGEPKQVVGDESTVPDTTISVWFKADRAPTGSERFFIYETAPTFTLSLGLRAGSEGNTLVQLFTESPSAANPNIDVEVPDGVIAGQWVHVATTLSLDQNEYAVIVNGGDDFPSGATATGPLNVPDLATFDNFHIGTFRGANGRWFPGLMDGFAIWDRILTPEELASLSSYTVAVTTTADEDDGFLGGGSGISLREAINHAPTGAVITFAPALSGETLTLAEGQLLIDHSLTIDASALPDGITIDANGEETGHRVMRINPGHTVHLHGLTLMNGRSSSEGGAIFNDRSALTVTACTLSGNESEDVGGAILNEGGILTVMDSTLSDNSSSYGAAIYNDGSFHGAAVLTVNNSTLSGNHADISGGGIFNEGRNDGDAIVTLTNSTLSGNSAARDDGGGIYNRGLNGSATVTLIHSTFSGNHAEREGGGIFNDGTSGGSAILTLVNSIVAANTDNASGPDILNDEGTVDTDGVNLLSGLSGSGLTSGASVLVAADPLLAPLADYGGPTRTMHPLPGSPAISAGGARVPPVEADQRGVPRDAETPTPGAVEAGFEFTVASGDDDGPGSLREAIRFAGPEAAITFDPGLSGATLALTEGQLPIDRSLTIDASALPRGLTIDAGNQSRVMEITPGHTVALHRLALTGGNATNGGAILNNSSTLTLTGCTLIGNTATNGGAIYNVSPVGDATLVLHNSTLTENSASFGGGIYSASALAGDATVTLRNSTLAENTASSGGGGIHSIAFFGGSVSVTAIHCTIAGNTASSSGGGISSSIDEGAANLTVTNSLFADNAAPSGPDVRNDAGHVSATGRNILSNLSGSGLSAGATVQVAADPLLTPLGDYGGPTPTLHPLSGSPAIDAGGVLPSPEPTDQRGLPRDEGPDIGAVEARFAFTVANNSDSGPGSLREAVGFGGPGTSITFAPEVSGEVITLTNGQFLINRSLTIDASDLDAGLIINADNQSRVMEITPGNTVSLHNLILTGGNASGTGFAAQSGGAILNNRSHLTLTGCALTGNSARFGGAISSVGDAGNDASLTLTDSTLSNNDAEENGGAIHNIGVTAHAGLDLTRCVLSGNSAASRGGALFNEGPETGAPRTLTECLLAGNTAQVGGAIYNRTNFEEGAPLVLTACTLSGNTATLDGGAIYNRAALVGTAVLHLINSTLVANLAENNGGALFNNGGNGSAPITLRSSTLTDNTAGNSGGAIRNFAGANGSADLAPANSIVAVNHADGGTGPDISNDRGTVTPTGTNLLGDAAASSLDASHPAVLVEADPRLAPLGHYGGFTPTVPPRRDSPAVNPPGGDTTSPETTDQRGAPRITGGTLDIGAVEFQPTVVTSIHDEPGSPELTLRQALNREFASTVTFDPALSGGTITLDQGPVLIDRPIDIDASGLPDGITIDAGNQSRVMEISPGHHVFLDNLTLTGGNTSGSGGGILSEGARLTLANCTITGNSAGEDGGGVHFLAPVGSDITFRGSTFSDNTAGNRGGGIHYFAEAHEDAFTLLNCAFANNSALDGGGLHNDSSNVRIHVNLADTLFTGNTARRGGGIFNEGGAAASVPITVNVTDCHFSGNVASGGAADGGGIFSRRHLVINVHRSTFLENTAGGAGGGLYGFGGGNDLNLRQSTLSGNTATVGAGLYHVSGPAGIDQSTFSANTASDGGGGLAVQNATLSVDRSTFSENAADNLGGGMLLLGSASQATVDQTTLFGNSAGTDGGGIGHAGTLVVRHATLTGNTAGNGGGGIENAGNLTLANSIVAGNSAPTGSNIRRDFTDGGDNLTSADPRLAPLGHYGGPTATMPPLPGSPAIDAAGPTDLATDQRGLPRPVGSAPDIGAVEFQGRPDLARFWEIDFDGDGRPFGLAFATGPAGGLIEPVRDSDGGVRLGFDFNPQAVGLARWTLEFSPDLSPGSWVPVFRSTDPEESSAWEFPDDITVILDAGSDRISIHDERSVDRAFYRLAVAPASQ